jgi:ABC-type Fe3+-hydroxamate transport system substrate-binding protein
MPEHESSRFRGKRLNYAWIAIVVTAVLGVAAMVIGRVAREGQSSLSTVNAKEPRIVSLLPQATEIIVSIGCGDHLAAVSNFDADPRVAHLPRVGDYQTIDWEKIAFAEPNWIITHYGSWYTPAGFIERADRMGARRLNIVTETLDGPDKNLTIFHAIEQLGRICNEPQKAAIAADRLRARIAAVRARSAGVKPVPGLIVIGADGTMVAGKDTFLNELFELAGGTNVAGALKVRYPIVDAEQIMAMHPQVIVQLLPNAIPQVIQEARHFWAAMPDVPAVKNGRIVPLTGWYVMLPGYHAGDIAEEFEKAIHPERVSAVTMLQLPAPSPLYSGERAGVRGDASTCALRHTAPHPNPLP